MRIALVHDFQLPVAGYGGTERVVWWLAKGLHQLGVEVVLVCREGSTCSFADVFNPLPNQSLESQLPEVDLFHHFVTPANLPERPYLVTIGGNGRQGETFLPNTVFVSRNHAERHGAEAFVYNGLDPDEYFFSEQKDDYLCFLAKASWKVKNVRGAISLARRSGRSLRILGGSRWWWNHRGGIHWEGTVGGERKARLVARASALLFPVLWHEPFGIAVTEALVSGTPVIASRHGSLPELVPSEVGAICSGEESYLEAIAGAGRYRPSECRDWALSKFHYLEMARSYLKLYERAARGEALNSAAPVAKETAQLLDW